MNGPPPDHDPDKDRQSARDDHRVGALNLELLRSLIAAPVLFVFSYWRHLVVAAIFVGVSIAAVLAYIVVTRVFPWAAQKWPSDQTLVIEVTVVVLVLLVAVLVAHAVILTRPFPKPSPTALRKKNHRLREIAAAVHSAIEAGRRG